MSMTRYIPLLALVFFFPQLAGATNYYVDFSAACGKNGLATTSPFCSINNFTDNARSAGDKAFVRRGQATTTGVVAATFTSDGTLNAPIVVSADYDNLWNTFKNTAQTYTLAFGSTTMTASANQSDVVVGDWLYAVGDCTEVATTSASFGLNPCEFAYEVSAVASTSITFYLPYKGPQTGAGITLRNMKSAPQIGTVTEANQIFTLSLDDYWYIKGLDLRSTNASCVMQDSSPRGGALFDMVFQANGAGDCAINTIDNSIPLKKARMFNFANAFGSANVRSLLVNDFFADCNNTASSNFIPTGAQPGMQFSFYDGTVANCTNLLLGGTASAETLIFRNVKNNNTYSTLSGVSFTRAYFEDNFGTVGLNSQTSNQISADSVSTTTISDTANLRAGGGPTNLHIRPPSGTSNTGLSTKNFPSSYIKLFEYPIYANTTSKTYTIYFMSTSTTNFASNPFTSTQAGSSTPEMYIECEYYNESSGADRYLKRSNTASAINFTGSTAWQGISVTCQPTQSGILYLRGWYGKPNDGKSDWFFMDTTPVVS